jgi:hypothetical protein
MNERQQQTVSFTIGALMGLATRPDLASASEQLEVLAKALANAFEITHPALATLEEPPKL